MKKIKHKQHIDSASSLKSQYRYIVEKLNEKICGPESLRFAKSIKNTFGSSSLYEMNPKVVKSISFIENGFYK